MTRRRAFGLTGVIVTAVFLVGGWLFLAPVQVGGGTGYVATSGNSMNPGIERGDLVLTRARGSYAVGDIVLYHSPRLDRDVLHRIVEIDGASAVTKGDNNDFKDGDPVALDQIRGEAWLVVPGVGGALMALRQPVPIAAGALVLILLVAGGGREVARRRSGMPRAAPVQVTETRRETNAAMPRAVLTAGVVSIVLFGALAALAWSRAESRIVTVAEAWAHTGTFSYEATVPRSAVYPTGRVETGETAFSTLVRAVNVSFDYSLESAAIADVRGGIGLDAVLSDGRGWTRPVPLTASEPFSGPVARVEGRLDLRRLQAIVTRMRETTGSTVSTFGVTLQPRIDVAGYTGSTVLDEAYLPAYELQFDDIGLQPVPGEGDEAQVAEVREAHDATVSEPARLAIGPLGLAVADARALSALGLIVALAVSAAAGLLVARGQRGSERARIHARFGERIVTGQTVVPDGRWITDLDTIDDLARAAHHYDRVIVHAVEGSRDVYLVDDGVVVYRFVTGGERIAATGVALPAGR